MNDSSDPNGRLRPGAVLAGLAAGSAAGLMFEITLTRVFAVTQFYHFAFFVVSLALLGFGASGSVLTVVPALGRGGPRRWALLAGLQGVTTVGGYLVANALPFDSFAIAWDRTQILYLIVDYVALAVPFFFGGALIGALLAAGGGSPAVGSHRAYGASLAGSGLGCLIALGGLDAIGAEATVILSGAVAVAGALLLLTAGTATRRSDVAAAVATLAVLLVPAAAVPAPLEMQLSPYKDLSAALRYPGAEIVATSWDGGSRVDHLRSDGIRSLPGLSLTYTGAPPPQDGVTFDGDDLSPIPLIAPDQASFAPHLLGALPFLLRPGGEVAVLEPRGGLDVVAALAAGASSVTAVEPYGDAVAAARRRSGNVYDDPRVTVIDAEARAYAERSDDRFDVIDLALSAPYRPVTSGAYSLREDYRLTVEAFDAYLDRLEPGGVLGAMRWLQTPPSEETRLLATAAEALRRRDVDPAAAVVALRGYSTALVLIRPDGFDAADLSRIRGFAAQERFDLFAAPGLDPAEKNRFNVLPDERYAALAAQLLATETPDDAYARSDFDIRPPVDDRPFFGHFFTWAQASDVLDTLGKTWQPFGGAGYFVLLALLGLAAAGALVLIVGPLAFRRRVRPAPPGERRWTVGYFALLGAAFLLVEIPLVQQSILLIGRPAAAFAVVLFAVLTASGIGSVLSPRIPWRPGAAVLVGVALGFPFLLRWVTPLLLPAPSGVRMLAVALLIAPLGMLMGIMFPKGVARLERRAPDLVPWAWAVNGTVSVIASVGAALVALSAGFSAVILTGAACYGAAALLARPGRATTRPG